MMRARSGVHILRYFLIFRRDARMRGSLVLRPLPVGAGLLFGFLPLCGKGCGLSPEGCAG